MAKCLVGNIVPECVGDVSILLIDNDTTSTVFLTSMLEQFSYNVMSVNVASEAISMIEKQEKIKFVIANIEMPHIDSPSFINALLHKDIPLILITPEIEMKKASDMLRKGARFYLKKPISETDIQNLFQHVLTKKTQDESQERIVEKETKQMEAFRETLKRQRTTTSQASLLCRRPFIETFATSERYRKRKNIENFEGNTKPVLCPIEIEKKRAASTTLVRPSNLWTHERHTKFLAAISILGEKASRPKSILKIMNDPDLTLRQVGSHLQKFKGQVERISDLPRKEWRSSTDKTFQYPSDYEFPFKASNLKKFLLSSNSALYNLKKNNSSSLPIVQYSSKKHVVERNTKMPNFNLGGRLERNYSLLGNVLNKSSMEVNRVPLATSNNPPYNIPSTDDVNLTGLVNDDLPVLPSLPSSVDPFLMGSSRTPIPQPNPNPFLEIDLNPIPIPDLCVPQADQYTIGGGSVNVLPDYTMNPLETNINHLMDWLPSTENFLLPGTGMNIIPPQFNTNQMDGAFSGEGYLTPENRIPYEPNINHMGMVSSGENYLLPQDMIFYQPNYTNQTHLATNMTLFETNINQMDSVSSRESYVLPGTHMTQVGLHPCGGSFVALLDNKIAPGTDMEETGFVSCEVSSEVPIEDYISFETDVSEMEVESWLENYHPSVRNIALSTSNLCHDVSFNTTPMDSIPPITPEGHNIEVMNHGEGVEGGDNFNDMGWIDQIYNIDA